MILHLRVSQREEFQHCVRLSKSGNEMKVHGCVYSSRRKQRNLDPKENESSGQRIAARPWKTICVDEEALLLKKAQIFYFLLPID